MKNKILMFSLIFFAIILLSVNFVSANFFDWLNGDLTKGTQQAVDAPKSVGATGGTPCTSSDDCSISRVCIDRRCTFPPREIATPSSSEKTFSRARTPQSSEFKCPRRWSLAKTVNNEDCCIPSAKSKDKFLGLVIAE